MPKSLKDPQWIATGLLAALLALSIYLVQNASTKADAASDKADTVESDLKAHVSGQVKHEEALLRQLDRIEKSIVRIDDKLTVMGRSIPGGVPMIPTNAAVVHSIGYDVETGSLYVRFLTDVTKEPGPIYRYAGVTADEFLALADSKEPSEWVWDNLRVRGTMSGHTRDYELVGIGMGHVPRKAVLRPDGEWFVPRTVLSESGEWMTSGLPEEQVEK